MAGGWVARRRESPAEGTYFADAPRRASPRIPPPLQLPYLGLLNLGLLLGACGAPAAESPAPAPAGFPRAAALTRADSIVFDAIAAAGQWGLDTATVTFAFRDRDYGLDRRGGRYVYTRAFTDSTGARVEDVLTNDDFTRSVNGRAAFLRPREDSSAREGLNSVVYFAFLPRWLADPAARRAYDGPDTLRDRAYHRIRVTFAEEGGGVDFRDEFLYWFDAEDLSLDYLAYTYATDEGGIRFRESYNEREVGGLTVRDYRNYRPGPGEDIGLGEIARAWEIGDLELLSTIALEDVRVVR